MRSVPVYAILMMLLSREGATDEPFSTIDPPATSPACLCPRSRLSTGPAPRRLCESQRPDDSQRHALTVDDVNLGRQTGGQHHGN